MDRALRDALLAYGPSVAATRSWQSYRIQLASKLRSAVTTGGAPAFRDAVIQAPLRWKTPASLLIYARNAKDVLRPSFQACSTLTSLPCSTPPCRRPRIVPASNFSRTQRNTSFQPPSGRLLRLRLRQLSPRMTRPLVAATRSWHSYRIRLASKLRAAVTTGGAPAYSDAVIQALLRWKTPASFLIYVRYDTDAYVSILQSVQHVDITSVQYANLPETSECARLDLLAETAELELPATLREASPPPAPAALPTGDSVTTAPLATPLDNRLLLPPSPSHSPASSSSGAPVCPSHSPGGVARPNRRPPFSSTKCSRSLVCQRLQAVSRAA